MISAGPYIASFQNDGGQLDEQVANRRVREYRCGAGR